MDLPCIVANLDIEAYHQHEAISRSSLMSLKRSPFHYWYEHLSGEYKKSEPTPDLILGNAVHSYLLEQDSFWSRYIVCNKVDRRTKAGKQEFEANLMEAGNKILLDNYQMHAIEAMAKSVYANHTAHELLKGAKYEQSIFWRDTLTEVQCKARPDIWQPNFIADIKTCADAGFDAFQGSLFKWGYHIQAAMIQEGIKHATGEYIKDFVFIAIEKIPPYAVACYQLDEFALQGGVDEFYHLLAKLRVCRENNEWPAYKNDIISLPRWAI